MQLFAASHARRKQPQSVPTNATVGPAAACSKQHDPFRRRTMCEVPPLPCPSRASRVLPAQAKALLGSPASHLSSPPRTEATRGLVAR